MFRHIICGLYAGHVKKAPPHLRSRPVSLTVAETQKDQTVSVAQREKFTSRL